MSNPIRPSNLAKLLFYGTILTFVRVPYWTVLDILPWRRPRASWTLKKCIMVRIIRYLIAANHIEVPGLSRWIANSHQIKEGKGVRGVWVEAAPQLIVGDVEKWAEVAGVASCRIPGYWQHKQGLDIPTGAPAAHGEKILYFLHSGGFIAFSAHPDCPTAPPTREILKICPSIARTFSLEYRLSVAPSRGEAESSFPAALIDAVAGYRYLLQDIGFKPEDIILSGDSAGGNLALALTRYALENPDLDLPRPGGILLLSPWIDLSPVDSWSAKEVASSSLTRNVDVDIIINPLEKPATSGEINESDYSVIAYVGPLGLEAARTNRYISPASLNAKDVIFEGFPNTFILVGDGEIFLDQVRVLKDRMAKDMGGEMVAYHEAPDCVHDFLSFDWFEPERSQALATIAAWVAGL